MPTKTLLNAKRISFTCQSRYKAVSLASKIGDSIIIAAQKIGVSLVPGRVVNQQPGIRGALSPGE